MKDWKTYKEESFKKDPELVRLYKELEPEYQLARTFIEARLAKGLTQVELARKAGVGQTVIARLESGTANPTFGTMSKVASVLGEKVKITIGD